MLKGSERIAQLLVDTAAFRDLDEPTILTSGELGIYYINTEKLLQDDGNWVKYGESAAKMATYLDSLTQNSKVFLEVVQILASELEAFLSDKRKKYANIKISGGQRRDWLFSIPVAKMLGLDHISLYKQTKDNADRLELNNPKLEFIETDSMKNWYSVHMVDLVTEGSSIYNIIDGRELGWVPMLRNKGVQIDRLYSVVTRLQGGEERLKSHGVSVESFVKIDSEFLAKYSKFPERSVEYIKNPSSWAKSYIEENGALMFLDFFNPDGDKLDRALKFLARYREVLSLSGKLEELRKELDSKYGLRID